jgi:hypothetical protein
VDDACLVQRLERQQQLRANEARGRLWQVTEARLPDVQREVAAAAVVEGEVEVLLGLQANRSAQATHARGMDGRDV